MVKRLLSVCVNEKKLEKIIKMSLEVSTTFKGKLLEKKRPFCKIIEEVGGGARELLRNINCIL